MSFMRPHYPVLEEEGGDKGAGGGGAGEDKDGDKGNSKGSENTEMLMRGMAVVAKGISEMQNSNKELLEFMRTQAEKGSGKGDEGGGEGGGDKGSKGGLFDGVDMEQLDRKDFAAMLLAKFEDRLAHHMKEAVKPLDERLGKVSDRVENDLANREINTAAGERPDFYEWRAEIAQLVKDNPGLSVTRAYTVARSENKDKATKMDEKYVKKSEAKSPAFVGLTPTGGGGRGEGATKMKFNEAAEKAYADVLSSLGGVSLDQLPVVGGKGR